jgi:hypothetical protein
LTIGKSVIPYGGNATSYGYARELIAEPESGSFNSDNVVRYGYAGKVIATVKSATPNGGNGTRYGYAGEAGAVSKSATPNGYCIREVKVLKFARVLEGILVNSSYVRAFDRAEAFERICRLLRWVGRILDG